MNDKTGNNFGVLVVRSEVDLSENVHFVVRTMEEFFSGINCIVSLWCLNLSLGLLPALMTVNSKCFIVCFIKLNHSNGILDIE